MGKGKICGLLLRRGPHPPHVRLSVDEEHELASRFPWLTDVDFGTMQPHGRQAEQAKTHGDSSEESSDSGDDAVVGFVPGAHGIEFAPRSWRRVAKSMGPTGPMILCGPCALWFWCSVSRSLPCVGLRILSASGFVGYLLGIFLCFTSRIQFFVIGRWSPCEEP